jgi:hypothetical protein
MKITDKLMEMLISSVIKKGVLTEAKKFETDVSIPFGESGKDIKISIKCENLTITLKDNC